MTMTLLLLLLVLLLQLTTIPNNARCVMMVTEATTSTPRRCRLMIHWFVFDFHFHCRTATRHCVKLVQLPARSRIVLGSARYFLVLNLALKQYVATVSPHNYRFARDGKIVQHIVLEPGNPRNNTAATPGTTTVSSITGRTTFATTVRVVTVRQCTGTSKRGGHSAAAASYHHSAQVDIVYGGCITAHGDAPNFGRFQARSEVSWPVVGVFARFATRRTLPAVR
uniref:Putative secreted protein n=1 Tax=Anopheles triannulatus TaxID=58253 RepID=A0A2M4B250_9DIPT